MLRGSLLIRIMPTVPTIVRHVAAEMEWLAKSASPRMKATEAHDEYDHIAFRIQQCPGPFVVLT
jgi:hypothetical protein